MPGRVPHSDFFGEIKQYVGFDETDSRRLAELLPVAEPHFQRIVDHFYDVILKHPSAHAAITGGTAQVERLKGTLINWMRTGLAGPHDSAFYDKRCEIGRVHVRIDLPQRYMLTAMNLMRLDFRDVLLEAFPDTKETISTWSSLDRLFDLELAIMLETYREDSTERLRSSERLATIGQLAASIGHDLRNPLGVIESSLYILRKRISDDERTSKHLNKISKQVETSNRIVTDLLELARGRPPKSGRLDVEETFRAAVEAAAVPAEVTVELDVTPGLEVVADEGLLQRVLVNLIGNSILAYEGKSGRIELSAMPLPNDRVQLRVRDHGPGFDPKTLARVFEPMFTTRARGTGLGLALVHNIVSRHAGSVSARNTESGGAEVTIELAADADPGGSE
jgi:signal transduction histidine kinase